MTNPWTDIKNADCVMIIGANAAENHPISFKYVTMAQEKGAKLIVVDPRFTRSAAKADIYAPLRSGTDIAFISGIVNYILEKNLYKKEYVTEYTDASFIVDTGFKGAVDLDGLYSGYNAEKRTYDKSTWKYQLDDKGVPKMDKTLSDPNCVFQLMKKQYARYTPDAVCQITGTPKDVFQQVCETYGEIGKPGKAAVIMYAMGTTQHTYGTQNIRAYSILQMLVGSIGVAGGGIAAMRGESNVQGSTDMGLLSHLLTSYLKVPTNTDATLAKYLTRTTPATKDPLSLNWWSNTPKYVVSMLKAWYGDAATKDNDFGFHYLPKVSSANYTHIAAFEAMYAGKVKGLMCWGQNPAVGGPNSNLEKKAMEKLEWLVCADLWETETSIFWKAPGVNPADIKTEVFLLPAASSVEKEGTITNSARMIQWRYEAVNPPGKAKSDAEIASRLMLKLKELYQAGGPSAESITKLTWDYGEHPHIEDVAREVNGYDLTTKKLIPGFASLKDDGSTSCGAWVYCGTFNADGVNLTKRRDNSDPSRIGLYSNWSFAWPMNRRIVYNRASVDLNGVPWDKEHPVITWDGANKKWVGDVADGGQPPMAVDPAATKRPFIMRPEGVACFFGKGMNDGPFPEHYEPWESPVKNSLSGTQIDPACLIWKSEMDYKGEADKYPIVGTTYRVTEHWQTGGMTRNLPWLNELMPDLFVEMSEELAKERGIKNGDKVTVESARGKITAVAIVTIRFKPFQINGKTVHEIGLPWHWGFAALAKGDIANVLTPHVGDANTSIPEYKAFLCDVKKA